jgi:predicted ATPase
MIGDRIDQYEILEEIGSGGMGTVYKAQDLTLDRTVAIKILKPDVSSAGVDWVGQLKSEAQAAARISSPNVVTIHQVSEDPDTPYIVMEYVRGRNLRQELKSRGSFDVPDVVRITCQVCDALTAAHREHILHKDIKPENIIISESDVVKVMDFGIAKTSPSGRVRDEEGAGFVGTAAYMSPEQALGSPLDERTDLYSLGAVMYELLTGRLPFEGDSVANLIEKKVRETAPLPSDLGFALPGKLESLVMKALENDPELRFRSAVELKRALLACVPTAVDHQPILEDGDAERGGLSCSSGSRAELVGRDNILGQLTDFLARATLGSGAAVALSGEAGVGKTAVLDMSEKAANRMGFVVLRGRGLYQDMPVPFFPYVSAIRCLFESPPCEAISPADRDEVKGLIEKGITELRLFVPYLATVLDTDRQVPSQKPVEGTRETDPSKIFAALGRLFKRVWERKPLLLILDDFQWVDRSSLQLFHYLGRLSKQSRMLMLAAYRPEELQRACCGSPHPVHDTLSRMETEGKLTHIEVERLSKSDTFELLRTALRNTRFTEEFKSALYMETLGNPAFILECLKSLREDGTVKWLDGLWQCVESIPNIRVPKRARDAIERRLECLGRDERKVLYCASVQGCTFTSDVLGAVLGMERLEVLTFLHELEKGYQIVRFQNGAYTFEHPLLWECAYDALSQELKQEYHLLVAKFLEEHSKPDSASVLFSLANHYFKGGDYERALPYLDASVRRAKELHAHTEALAHLEKALEALGHLPSSPDRTEMRLRLLEDAGAEAAALGDWKRALARYEEARGICTSKSDLLEYARLTRLMGAAQFARQNWDEAQSRFREAMSIYAEQDRVEEMGEIYLNLGGVSFELGGMEEVIDLFGKALEIGEALEDRELIARACNNLGAASNVIGERHRAIEYYQKSLDNCVVLEDRVGETRAYHNIGMTYSELKNWAEAASFFKKASVAAEELNNKALHCVSTLALAEAYVRLGRLRESEELCERGLAGVQAREDKLSLADGYRILGLVRAKEKRYEEAADFFEKGIQIARRVNSQLQQAEGLRELGLMLKEKGDVKGATEALSRAKDIFKAIKADENAVEVDNELNFRESVT